ncbi:hypothetical protein ES705_35066 [subsurface metagenome]
MKIKIMEHTGEIDKRGETLTFSVSLDLDDPGFLERFSEEREKILSKYLKERIKQNEIIKAKHINREERGDRSS